MFAILASPFKSKICVEAEHTALRHRLIVLRRQVRGYTVATERCCRDSCTYLRASIAASTFGGDIGSSVSRRPTARSIALAMAAIGGQMLTSATPLAP